MATITPNSPTFSTPIAAASFSSSATPGTTVTLDLTTKWGAWLHCRIGRNAATALTRAARINIRRQDNNTLILPTSAYDFVSTIGAVTATTLNGALSIGATTALLTSGTGFAANDVVCMNSAGARVEFASITDLTTNTITFDRSGGLRVAHNSGDTITNGADVASIWIPGGDIWEITPVNNSGQTVIIGVDAAVYASDNSA